MLISEVAVCDFVNATDEMASRFELWAVPRWRYGEEYLALLDSLEAALPLAKSSEVLVYDYIDGAVPVLARMAAKRRTGYRALGYRLE